jgi:hypothetical protein
MAYLWQAVEEIRKAIRKEIYSVTPAGSLDGKFSAHKTHVGSLVTTVEKPRKFDVVSSGVSPETVSWGTTSNDREAEIKIVIGYGVNENWNELAQSDYLSIVYKLHNYDSSLISGLNFFRVDAYDWVENDDFRYMIIPVIARITTTNQ